MKVLAKILAYCAGTLVIAALVAPPLYFAGHFLAHWFPLLGDFGFGRYFRRAALVAALGLLIPFLRWLDIQKFTDLGLQPNERFARDVGVGVLLALAGVWFVSGVQLAAPEVRWHAPLPWVQLVPITLTAVAVALIEEIFFRGALLGALQRRMQPLTALAVLSLVFAAVHFIKPVDPKGPIFWYSGFELLPRLFSRFMSWRAVWSSFLTLVGVGLVLGYATQKTKSLALAIGLHGGWVFALQSFDELTKGHVPRSLWFGGRQLLAGLAPLLLMVATWLTLILVLRRRNLGTLFFLLVGTVTMQSCKSPSIEPAYQQEMNIWYQERDKRLRDPNGWLTLVGLFWLESGLNTVGSDSTNAVILPKAAPGLVGSLHFDAATGAVTFRREGASPVLHEGQPVESVILRSDADKPGPTILALGDITFFLIKRDTRLGVRVKDKKSPVLTAFRGMERFALDPKWRVVGKLRQSPEGQTLDVPTVLGTIEKMPSRGRVVFEVDGRTLELDVVDAGEREVSVIFGDVTNGKETYGGGREVDGEVLEDGRVLIDFNKAYNPPCSFTPYATCPLPPKHNRLPVAVQAGEKAYNPGGS